ncbi:MAG: antibiotic biosynthesis monooxygenase [Chitinivorax sp.]
MISATFIFDPRQFDDEFHALDAQIAAAARQTDGYLGEEAWQDPKTGRIANVYYWQSETGLRQLMNHPQHLAAKQRYQQWLSGYQVIVSQVLRSYGDGGFAHPAQPLATQS